ncbi:MAG: 1,4-dihydroxy-2-naphthoate polyprenyltransferase [Actinobacteria bacterium]|nr:1,4-dihydroxy-2-naphthoate polyprenyltransferase [Actinomycetota bacterium]
MTSAALWWQGARPRTLPASLAPVAVGAGCAAFTSTRGYALTDLAIAFGCIVVALALQVGVNYANDYSDGIRGTDTARVGPVRLVGGGLAPPATVKRAAFAAFGVAAVAGLMLVLITGLWWLLLVGAAAIAAAWFYTGGPRPYGYAGLGELFVFIFFGLVAVVGTAACFTGSISLLSVVLAVPVGSLAVAILVANNLRDIRTDVLAGKHTLAARIGDRRTRDLFVALIWVPFVVVAVVAVFGLIDSESWPSLAALALVAIPMGAGAARQVRRGAAGPDLIVVLGETARLELVFSLLLAIGTALSSG